VIVLSYGLDIVGLLFDGSLILLRQEQALLCDFISTSLLQDRPPLSVSSLKSSAWQLRNREASPTLTRTFDIIGVRVRVGHAADDWVRL
jgi:hypothetical protein